MVSHHRIWVMALAVLLSSACASSPDPRFLIGGRGQNREVRIQVVNDNFADMGVFVMDGATSFRLGDVVGKTSATFTLDLDKISPSSGLRLLADPIGSRDAYLSDPVYLGGGAQVVFTIAAALSQSHIILR